MNNSEIKNILENPRFWHRKLKDIKIIRKIDLFDYIIVETNDIEDYKFKIIDVEKKNTLSNFEWVWYYKLAISICLDKMYKSSDIFFRIAKIMNNN